MDVRIEEGWKKALERQWNEPYFIGLTDWVRKRYREGTVYPPAGKIFAAFDNCPYDDVRVVIIGQDPYHGPGQANGLCFSVDEGVPYPPSLNNIFKEIAADTGNPVPLSGNLKRWAQQGVLLLNSTLTVDAGKPASHAGKGWETFTDAVIRTLAEKKSGLVFILWGSYAIKKGAFIDRNRHLVLESAHPSPLSAHRGFFGNHHFSLTNKYLISNGKEPIKW